MGYRFAASKMVQSSLMASVLLVISSMSVLGDDIYTWTDSKGTVHISQTPHKGAKVFSRPDERQDEKQITKKSILFLGGLNETRYFLDRESIQMFANDRNKYKFNLYVNDKMYTCTAWAYPSGVIGLEPRVGLPDLVQIALKNELLGK